MKSFLNFKPLMLLLSLLFQIIYILYPVAHVNQKTQDQYFLEQNTIKWLQNLLTIMWEISRSGYLAKF